jgi:phage tail tape-measure protein
MTVWRGGRGVKAPYESTHVRIPVPIKDKVEALSQAYKDGTLDDLEPKTVDLGNAIELARGILKQKKSARVSLENLLKAIYGEDICL